VLVYQIGMVSQAVKVFSLLPALPDIVKEIDRSAGNASELV